MAHGQLFARLSHQNGATRLIEHRQNAPLKIARTFPNAETGSLEICVMDASPGLLSGDNYQIEWILEAGAQARITAQGATRVHPSHSKVDSVDNEVETNSGSFSSQALIAQVKAGAGLEIWPETIIPFCGADFRSENRIFLEDAANFSSFECLSAGRIARGEAFEFDRVQIKTRVYDARGPLFCAQNDFMPAKMPLAHPFGFGGATHWANFIAFGPIIPNDAAKIAQRILEEREIFGASSSLSRGGIAVSMLGNRAYDLREAALNIEKIWKAK